MIIKVISRYAAEDEAIISLICRLASKKYSQNAGILKKDGVLIEYPDGRNQRVHISGTEDISDELALLFCFADSDKYDKKLVIMNHSLIEYDEIIKKDFYTGDVILIKNYIPSYKSERTLFGPNELKSFFGKGRKIFALELDVRIQNHVFMGIMESCMLKNSRYECGRCMDRQLAAIYKALAKED